VAEVSAHNQSLSKYSAAIAKVAREHNALFISLQELTGGRSHSEPLTENGIHLSARGYEVLAQAVGSALGWDNHQVVSVQAKGGQSNGLEARTTRAGAEFTTHPDRVAPVVLRAKSLRRGDYILRINGRDVAEGSARDWERGVRLERGPDVEQQEQLGAAILRKNQLCVDRLRPQNETYLFGFRKHEQGQNAKEIPMFDPLIADEEALIERLRQPVARRYELIRTTEAIPAYRSTMSMDREGARRSSGSLSATQTGLFEEPPVFDLAPGVHVNLYAQSPLLAKPIQMNFDARGRLWIASSAVYPQVQPGQVADDKILVLEDTNHDGFAETSKIFADGLLIPTAVVPGDGGVYVGQGTQLLHFSDTDGDGKADRKRIVLSAFGTEDTHHMVHTLRWGPEGQLYFNQSIYIHTHIETPHGVRRLNSGGVWQFQPHTLDLGVFVRGFCNPWGHAFDDYGQSFITDGAGGQGISYGLPGATFFTYATMRREMASISPGSYPKFASLELIRSPEFPKDWQGNAITCDFRAHRVVRFGIEEKGAGYAAHEIADLMRTTNVTFRPIDVKLGPDGALYIADWSNPIIQHGEVDFRDPRRDHEHGRIWRVTYKHPKQSSARFQTYNPSALHLTSASDQELLDIVAGIDTPSAGAGPEGINGFEQQQARRILFERGGKAVAKSLAAWTNNQTNDYALMQALWLHEGLSIPRPALLHRILHAEDGKVRAAGVRVLAGLGEKIPGREQFLETAICDAHPRVRLEALRALATISTAKSASLALSALEQPMDSFLDYAAWLTINDLASVWVAAVKNGSWDPAGKEKQLEFALKAIEPSLASDVLAQVLASREIPADGSGPWIELIGSSGTPALLQKLYNGLLQARFNADAARRVLESLNTAARQRNAKPSEHTADLRKLLTSGPGSTSQQLNSAVQLAGAWKLTDAVPELAKIASDSSAAENTRHLALDSLREIGGEKATGALVQLSSDSKVGAQAILRLAALDLGQATPLAATIVTNGLADSQAAEFWRGWLSVKNSGPALARSLPKSGLRPEIAKAGLQAAREGGRNEPDLVWALTRAGGLEDESQTLSAAELAEIASKAMKNGDPARGERIFRRKELACTTCHAIGGVGGKVGPDLTSIGASAQPDYLIESVLYPNRKIKEGYHAISVETKDGLEYTGVLVSENTDQIILRDSTGKELNVPKKDIQNRRTGGSLMPAGLVDALQPSERLDLYRFLSELGKPGKYDAAKPTIARSWRVLVQTLELAQFGDEKVLQLPATDERWTKETTLVDGTLLKSQLAPQFKQLASREPQGVYLSSRFDVAKAQTIKLEMDGPKHWTGWIDAKPVTASTPCEVELTPGKHTFTVKVTNSDLPKSLRLSSQDVTFLNE